VFGNVRYQTNKMYRIGDVTSGIVSSTYCACVRNYGNATLQKHNDEAAAAMPQDATWQVLAKEAAEEKDPDKLMEIIKALTDALERRNRSERCSPLLSPVFSRQSPFRTLNYFGNSDFAKRMQSDEHRRFRRLNALGQFSEVIGPFSNSVPTLSKLSVMFYKRPK